MIKTERMIAIQKYVMAAVVVGALIALGVLVPCAFAAEPSEQSGQTGSGNTSLVLHLQSTGEYGGTGSSGSAANPDLNGDGLGDNLAFTVPTRIDFMVSPSGVLTGPAPEAIYIENESVYNVHVSSLCVSALNGWNIVEDALLSHARNSIDITLGPVDDPLNAASYLAKSNVLHPSAWSMGPRTNEGASDRVELAFSGHINNAIHSLLNETAFGQIEWYVTPGLGEGV